MTICAQANYGKSMSVHLDLEIVALSILVDMDVIVNLLL